jgi:CheY-like chemotaxis protein
MNGGITVTSAYGKGSTFKFDISVGIDQEFLQAPQATSVKADSSAPEAAPMKGKTRAPLTQPKSKSPFLKSNASAHTDNQPYRILVVEDNPANQLVLLKMLAQMNLAADMANHGKEAMELWLKQPYQVVLTDLTMPEMDGIELTRELRQREKTMGGAPVYIVGVTANVLPEYKEKCLQAGMNDFLLKPLKMESLRRALQKYSPSRV